MLIKKIVCKREIGTNYWTAITKYKGEYFFAVSDTPDGAIIKLLEIIKK